MRVPRTTSTAVLGLLACGALLTGCGGGSKKAADATPSPAASSTSPSPAASSAGSGSATAFCDAIEKLVAQVASAATPSAAAAKSIYDQILPAAPPALQDDVKTIYEGYTKEGQKAATDPAYATAEQNVVQYVTKNCAGSLLGAVASGLPSDLTGG